MIQLIISGHLGGDAETRDAGSDTVTSFSVAESKKLKSGEVTQWWRCSMWGKRGVVLCEYLRKGIAVTVVGPVTARLYEKDGTTRLSLDLNVKDVALQGSKGVKKDVDNVDPEWMK